MKVVGLTSFALIAFALNSILCRLALRENEIDAASFTTIRLVSGAVTLSVLLLAFGKTRDPLKSGNWFSAFFLFAYAICFSFAYLGLAAGTGALILFGSVQLAIIVVSIAKGERPSVLEWIGLFVAFVGLIYLVIPGLEAPPLLSAMLMVAAGAAWGLYTLKGKGSEDPLADTAGNFLRSVPMAVLISLPFLSQGRLTGFGVLLAVLSGAVASGVGYTVWYAALRDLTATRASAVQLLVPVIAAFAGILMLGEILSFRLLIAGSLILLGIGSVIAGTRVQKVTKPDSPS